MAFHGSFNLYFPWIMMMSLFSSFIGHLSILLGETTIQILTLFFQLVCLFIIELEELFTYCGCKSLIR